MTDFDMTAVLSSYEGNDKIIVMTVDPKNGSVSSSKLYDRESILSCMKNELIEIIGEVSISVGVSLHEPVDGEYLLGLLEGVLEKYDEDSLQLISDKQHYLYRFISKKNRDYVFDAIYKKMIEYVDYLEANPLHSI